MKVHCDNPQLIIVDLNSLLKIVFSIASEKSRRWMFHFRGKTKCIFFVEDGKMKKAVAVLAMVIVILGAGVTNASLVAQYTFEGNFNDVSGNGHNGTISATGVGSIINDPERGMVFSNTSAYVDIHSTTPLPALAAQTSITLTAWVKQTAVATSPYAYILQVGNNGDSAIASLGVLADQRVASYSETDQPGTNADQVYTYSDGPVEAGAAWESWHHLAVVYDRSTDIATFYIDGVAAGTNDISKLQDTYGFTWAQARLGGDDNGTPYYQGLMDDVRYYDEALSAEEIAILAVPEPATMALLGLGGLLLRKRK